MTKLSVITINYNDKIGLEKTINSVVNQTNTAFEFIIIDGGSTDGSVAVIENYKNKLTYWISEKDTGVFNAMNKGIKVAKGEFLIFMNSGDVFHNQEVINEVLPLLQSDIQIFYGNNYKVSPTSKRLKTYPEKLSFSFFYSSSLNHQASFIKRQLFFDSFLYNETYKIASDWEFFVYNICYKNVPYKYINKTIADYDFTGISSSEKFSKLFETEKQQAMERFFPTFVNDYKNISELNSKRFQQFLHIKNYKWAFKILKTTQSFLLVFLPKFKAQS